MHILDITERELEILTLVAEGRTNREIAQHTDLTVNTVKWYLKELFSKLYVSNRTQAVARARELKLLSTGADTPTAQELPHALTTFLGRTQELSDIQSMLHESGVRLLTLHGVGGVGKTRLAVEVARQEAHHFEDGAVFVPLDRIDSPDDFALALAEAIQLPSDGQGQLARELHVYLRHKHLLLVLDNFEHILEAGVQLSDLLHVAPHVVALVTSREVLNIAGETVCALNGIAFPNEPNSAAPQPYPAVQLFLKTAEAILPDYAPRSDDWPAIAAICRLVEGMPLAVELAAPWVDVLSPAEILAQIAHNLDFLQSDAYTLSTRHRSIRAVFNYSWDLLNEHEHTIMAQLAVFQGTFTLPAAQAVTDLTPVILKRLINKALVRRVGPHRFDLHNLLRRYAAEALLEDPALAQTACQRHAVFYLGLLHQQIDALKPGLDAIYLKPIEENWENILLAWENTVRARDWELLETAAENLLVFEMKSWWYEGSDLYTATLDALGNEHPRLRGKLLSGHAVFALRRADVPQAIQRSQESLALLHDTEAVEAMAIAAGALSGALLFARQYDAGQSALQTALALADRLDNLYITGLIRSFQGVAAVMQQDLDGARAIYEAFISAYRSRSWGADLVYHYLGEVHYWQGREDDARACFEESITMGLDHRGHMAVIGSAYYLYCLDHPADINWDEITAHMLDVAGKISSPLIAARIQVHLGIKFFLRGQLAETSQAFLVGLLMLDAVGENSSLFESLLTMTQVMMQAQQVERALSLLDLIIASPQCPASVRQAAHDILMQIHEQTVLDVLPEHRAPDLRTALIRALAEP